MYRIEFYNTKGTLISTKNAGYKQVDALQRNCKSCRCYYTLDEDCNFKVYGTKVAIEDLMFWARLK